MNFDDQLILRAFSCFWRINNFHLCEPDIDLNLKSPIFKTLDIPSSKWHLEIRQDNGKSFGIYLFLENSSGNFRVNFSVYLLTKDRWVCVLKKCPHDFNKNNPAYGVHELVKWSNIKKEKEKYLPNNSLTVSIVMSKSVIKSAQCFILSRMTSKRDIINTSMQEYKFIKPSDFFNFDEASLPESIGDVTCARSIEEDSSQHNTFDSDGALIQYFKANKVQFVTLQAGDKTFIIHQALLCSVSPVFNEMLEFETEKSNERVLKIDDIDGDTLSLLLQFLHHVPLGSGLEWREVIKLYYAAEKYQINQLKEDCTVLMKKNISHENVCEAFVLADLLKHEEIKTSAQEYFCKHSKTILRSEQWKSFMLENTDLVSEILSTLADKL